MNIRVDKDEDQAVTEMSEYKERLLQKKIHKWIMTGMIIALIIGGIFWVKHTINHWNYKEYKIITQEMWDETSTVKYMQAGENILKYGGDDITLLSRQGEELWNEPYLMENPIVNVSENTGVVYDKKGSKMIVFDINGKQGEIKTIHPVVKAKVSPQGIVAAILEEGDITWIYVYDFKGNEIVTAKTSVDNPGYPVDLSLSDDGLNMAVTYFCVKDYQPSSYVAFYNFGDTGQNQMDNQVSAYTYKNVLVPAIEHVSDSEIIGFRDDGFTIYKGQQIPEETKTVKLEDNAVSVFTDRNHVGYIFNENNGEHIYRLELYDIKGNKLWTSNVNIPFDKAYISGNVIILHNKNQFAVYSMNGTCRYQGSFKEGNIENIFNMARNRYMIIMNNGYATVKLT